MVDIPVQGTPGVFDPRNPTLIPNFDVPTTGTQGTLGLSSPAVFIANNARANATETATIGGSVTNGNTIELTFTCGTISGGSFSVTYPVVTADTLSTVAEGLADLVNSSAAAQAAGLQAQMGGTGATAEIVFSWPGPVGNFCTISATLSAGASETVTFGNAGVLAGGSGPIIPTGNFNWAPGGGEITAFFYGRPANVGYDQVTQMVAQGMPIV